MEDNNTPTVPSQSPKHPLEASLKKVIYILSAVAVVLLGLFLYFWITRHHIIKDLRVEKQDLQEQMIQLRSEYDSLSTNNDSLNVQLDMERERIDILIQKVKETEASNRAKLRSYEKELGTLRSIMRSYIHQIDSLNTLNIHLRKDAATAREEAKASKKQYEELRTTTDEYALKVEKGSALKGRNFLAAALTANGKETERSSRTVKLRVCFSIIENSIAKQGPRNVYLRVKGPDGILLTGDREGTFTNGDEQLVYSSVREIDYQGEELEVCIFLNGEGFVKGAYHADVFSDDGPLGSTELLLK